MKPASLCASSRDPHSGLRFSGPVEPIEDFAIAVVAILRQRMERHLA